MTRRWLWLVAAALLALPGAAAEKSDSRKHIDQKSESYRLAYFLGPRVTYGDKAGLGVKGDLLDEKHGVLYSLTFDAIKIKAVNGSTVEDDGGWPPRGDIDPFHVDSRTRGVVAFGVSFRLGK